jgi:hypothetical protein
MTSRELDEIEFLSTCLGREVESVEVRWLDRERLSGYVVVRTVRHNRNGRPSKKPFVVRFPLRMVLSRSNQSAYRMWWRVWSITWPTPIGARPHHAPIAEEPYQDRPEAFNAFKAALIGAALDGARDGLEERT